MFPGPLCSFIQGWICDLSALADTITQSKWFRPPGRNSEQWGVGKYINTILTQVSKFEIKIRAKCHGRWGEKSAAQFKCFTEDYKWMMIFELDGREDLDGKGEMTINEFQ